MVRFISSGLRGDDDFVLEARVETRLGHSVLHFTILKSGRALVTNFAKWGTHFWVLYLAITEGLTSVLLRKAELRRP